VTTAHLWRNLFRAVAPVGASRVISRKSSRAADGLFVERRATAANILQRSRSLDGFAPLAMTMAAT
jgi:hypothetical protein